MALAPNLRYPAQTDAAAGYPQGKARNAVTFQDGTGTPLERDWLNDLWGFQQALLANAGIAPSGTPDQVGSSQYLAGVDFVAQARASAAQAAAIAASAITAADLADAAQAAAEAGAAADLREYALASHLTSFAPISLNLAPPTTTGLAAVYEPSTQRVMLVKGGVNGSHLVVDDGFAVATSDPGTLTLARDGAFDPASSTVVMVGTGGGVAARSTNFGTSWSDASTPPTARDSVSWDAVHGLFLAGRIGQADVYTSPTGAVWTARVLSGNGNSRVVVNADGVGLIGRGVGATIAFDRSTNGTTWASSGTTLPDVAAASSGVTIATLGATFFAAARWGTDIRLHSSPDGLAWTLIATIATNAAASSTTLWADASTGALYEMHGVGSNNELRASIDGGITWIGAARTRISSAAIQVAGGRMWANDQAVHRGTALRLAAA